MARKKHHLVNVAPGRQMIVEDSDNLGNTDSTREFKKSYHDWRRKKKWRKPKKETHSTPKKKSFLDKCKASFYRLKNKLSSRHHTRFKDWHGLTFTSLIVLALTIALAFTYKNINSLNETTIIILRLGSSLILILGIAWIKYVWKLLQILNQWFKRAKHWQKYLIIFLIIILLVLAYRGDIRIPSNWKTKYNDFDKTLLNPLAFGVGTGKEMQDVIGKKATSEIKGLTESVEDIVNPDPISEKTMEVEQAIFKYTNIERKKNGLWALSWNSGFAETARAHSLDMVENDYFAHNNVNLAENIGKMPTGNVEGIGYVSSDADSIGKAHVESWMKSPEHRANILGSYSSIGVGVAYDGLYYVATQNFR